jgi:RNA polymerase sigma-70 factor (ECF subfamily)
MDQSDLSTWLVGVLARRPGSEAEVVERYAQRLLGFARRQLPGRLRRRFDPEDVVQSVYRSFFRRLQDGQFAFDDSHDVWRLLATMTYCKTRNLVKFHQRGRRDVRREEAVDVETDVAVSAREPGRLPGDDDVAALLECLEQLLERLPANHREIVLKRLEGDSIELIATKVRRSRRTVLRVLAHVQEMGARELERGR